MSKAKGLLFITILMISVIMTIVTMYLYGSWQHKRYWNGTIVRINETESHVYIKLLSSDMKKILNDREYDKLQDIFKVLEGKLFIRLTDENGNVVFENSNKKYKLGEVLQRSQVKSGSEIFTIQIISYLPPSWNSVFLRWFSNYREWFSIKYDFITVPSISFFLIWFLLFTAMIWRYKAHLENDRLFNVLREFKANTNDDDERN